MTVTRSDGTIVPEMPIRESGVINSYWMTYDDFAELPEVFCQRNTEGRLSKAQKHLSTLIPEHCVVFVAKLTEPGEVYGKKYPAGFRWRIDSNTRALNWERAGSDCIPKDVFVIEYAFEDPDRIRQSYNTFDSPDSVERNQEKFYGIISGMYNYQPTSTKLIKGQIISALNKACHFYFPDVWNQGTVKAAELPGQVGAFLEEIKALDCVMKDASSWDQALVCAGLMALKKYGTRNQKLLDGLQDINDKAANTRGKDWDGISHIVDEWKTSKIFASKETLWHKENGLNRTVSYCCYWIDKYMKDETGSKFGKGWDKVAFQYKDQTVTALNHLLMV
jgi:hypothetical protein